MEDVRVRIGAWWLGLTALGAGIIAVPDSDEPVIRFSDNHGPGIVDLVGIVVILIGTAVLYNYLISAREAIVARIGRSVAVSLAVSWLGAVAFTIVMVVVDMGPWWLIGALDATATQAFALAMSSPKRFAT